ncbi:MAG: NUDIX domain-containing protein [Lentisphaeria bacterium]|nr:NUDIX domain-containing protein [Lentisphaeria bacterium]
MIPKVGVIPYILHEDKVQLVLIRNRSNTTWIFPKGNPEHNKTAREQALQEAWEEAGIRGTLHKPKIVIKNGQTSYTFYIMRVEEVANEYPENRYRIRKICSTQEAYSLIKRPPYQHALQCIINNNFDKSKKAHHS